MAHGIVRADTVLTRAPGVLAEPVGDGFVLLDPANDRYVRLNATGGWLFERLDEPRSPDDLAQQLRDERGAPAERALDDALEFAADLVRRGVLRTE